MNETCEQRRNFIEKSETKRTIILRIRNISIEISSAHNKEIWLGKVDTHDLRRQERQRKTVYNLRNGLL